MCCGLCRLVFSRRDSNATERGNYRSRRIQTKGSVSGRPFLPIHPTQTRSAPCTPRVAHAWLFAGWSKLQAKRNSRKIKAVTLFQKKCVELVFISLGAFRAWGRSHCIEPAFQIFESHRRPGAGTPLPAAGRDWVVLWSATRSPPPATNGFSDRGGSAGRPRRPEATDAAAGPGRRRVTGPTSE